MHIADRTVEDNGGDESVVESPEELGVVEVEVLEEVHFQYFPTVSHLINRYIINIIFSGRHK